MHRTIWYALLQSVFHSIICHWHISITINIFLYSTTWLKCMAELSFIQPITYGWTHRVSKFCNYKSHCNEIFIAEHSVLITKQSLIIRMKVFHVELLYRKWFLGLCPRPARLSQAVAYVSLNLQCLAHVWHINHVCAINLHLNLDIQGSLQPEPSLLFWYYFCLQTG